MHTGDISIRKYGVGSVLCSLCSVCKTSPLNYGVFSYNLQQISGLKEGYICLICQSKLKKLGDNCENQD